MSEPRRLGARDAPPTVWARRALVAVVALSAQSAGSAAPEPAAVAPADPADPASRPAPATGPAATPPVALALPASLAALLETGRFEGGPPRGLRVIALSFLADGCEPRGCALSFQTRFVAEFDEPLARRHWRSFVERYTVRHETGLVGLREYAPGRRGPADLDSGPVVHGVGAAATALGIAAARIMGDEALARDLEATGRTGDLVFGGLPGARGALPDAIRYLGWQLRKEP